MSILYATIPISEYAITSQRQLFQIDDTEYSNYIFCFDEDVISVSRITLKSKKLLRKLFVFWISSYIPLCALSTKKSKYFGY